jgi:hypothetical protein
MAIAMKKLHYDRITATIEREWLAEIIAGTKKIEYRKVKPYWTKRFEKVSVPFELRLLNGYPKLRTHQIALAKSAAQPCGTKAAWTAGREQRGSRRGAAGRRRR